MHQVRMKVTLRLVHRQGIDDRSIFYSNYFYIFILLIKPSNKHHICHIDADNKDAGQVSKNTNVGEELCPNVERKTSLKKPFGTGSNDILTINQSIFTNIDSKKETLESTSSTTTRVLNNLTTVHANDNSLKYEPDTSSTDLEKTGKLIKASEHEHCSSTKNILDTKPSFTNGLTTASSDMQPQIMKRLTEPESTTDKVFSTVNQPVESIPMVRIDIFLMLKSYSMLTIFLNRIFTIIYSMFLLKLTLNKFHHGYHIIKDFSMHQTSNIYF